MWSRTTGFDMATILPREQSLEKESFAGKGKDFFCGRRAFQSKDGKRDSFPYKIKSGRYEFPRIKASIFSPIDSFWRKFRKLHADGKPVLGVIFVPAHQTGPRKELLERMRKPDFSEPKTGELLTHYLQGAETDPICREVQKVELHNAVNDRVKIIFAPT